MRKETLVYKAHLQLGKQALECFRGNKHLNVALLVYVSITKKYTREGMEENDKQHCQGK